MLKIEIRLPKIYLRRHFYHLDSFGITLFHRREEISTYSMALPGMGMPGGAAAGMDPEQVQQQQMIKYVRLLSTLISKPSILHYKYSIASSKIYH